MNTMGHLGEVTPKKVAFSSSQLIRVLRTALIFVASPEAGGCHGNYFTIDSTSFTASCIGK